MKPERERLRLVGLRFRAEYRGQKLALDRHEAGSVGRLHVQLSGGFDFHIAVEERRLRGRKRERLDWIVPRFEIVLGADSNGESCQRFVGLARTEHKRACAVRLGTNAPVLERLAGNLKDFAIAREREGQFLRLALEDVDRRDDGVR